MSAFSLTLSAAARDSGPLALLLAQVKLASRQWCSTRMGLRVMYEIPLVRVVRRQRSQHVPEIDEALLHVRTSASATAGASELGGTGSPFTTRQLTRNMSTITIQRIAVSRMASPASRR